MRIPNRPLVHVLVIAIAVFIAYSNAFEIPFQLDDIDNIVNNPAIKEARYFTDPSWIDSVENTDVFDKPLFKTRYIGYLTFAANYALHGLNVRGYHLVNLLIHAANAVLLYWIIILTFRTPGFPRGDEKERFFFAAPRDFIALFTALLFAVHPVQTQAVTYIVQRFTSLATMFSLLALIMYIQFRLSGLGPGASERQFRSRALLKRYAAYTGSLVSVVLAMKTKEFGLLVPAVIALYEFLFFEGGVKQRLRYLVPFGLSMAILPITLLGMTGAIGAGGIDDVAAKISGAQGGMSRADYLFTQFRVIMTYLRLLFWPVDQAFDYDYPIFHSLFELPVAVSFLFLLSLLAGGGYMYRLSRSEKTKDRRLCLLCSFGIFWFFLTLSVESSIIPIADVIFEHRVYLPSVGFFLALSSVVALVAARWEDRTGAVKKALTIALSLLVVALSAATYARNVVWQDRVGLLEDDVRKSPGKARTHSSLGGLYAEQGRMNEALRHLRTAIALKPGYAEAHYSLGIAYAGLGRMEEAIYEYQLAIRIRFEYAEAHGNLGLVYAKLGRIEEAIREYRTALMITPYSAGIRNNLGNAYRKLGRRDEAVNEYLAALRLKPGFAEAHYNLGNTYADLGRGEEATAEYRAALRLRPDFPEARLRIERMGLKE
jgi:tetratricopeptide (TPR) repeat protein